MDAGVDLPSALGAWTRSDAVRKILPGKIFEYMDGAGELYLGYRFKYLEVAEYTAPEEDRILVELYWMDSSDDAFGLLSGDWGGEPVALKTGTKPGGPAWVPGHSALYGAGLLRLWSDDLYARVLAYRETTRSKDAVLQLGRLIAERREVAPAPALLASLPAESAAFKLRADRFCYFRSHLVLNSVYFLSTKNILDLDRSAEAVTASFVSTSAAGGSRSVQLLLIRYAEEKIAENALAHFELAYLPEKYRSSARSSPGKDRFWQIEDGWLGYARTGKVLVLAFECPDRSTAVRIVTDSIRRLKGLEAGHE